MCRFSRNIARGRAACVSCMRPLFHAVLHGIGMRRFVDFFVLTCTQWKYGYGRRMRCVKTLFEKQIPVSLTAHCVQTKGGGRTRSRTLSIARRGEEISVRNQQKIFLFFVCFTPALIDDIDTHKRAMRRIICGCDDSDHTSKIFNCLHSLAKYVTTMNLMCIFSPKGDNNRAVMAKCIWRVG